MRKNSREELIKELKELPSISWLIGYFSQIHDVSIKKFIEEELGNFIISDRKRICEPLVRWNEEDKKGCFGNDYNNHLEGAKKANRQTLTNAGLITY